MTTRTLVTCLVGCGVIILSLTHYLTKKDVKTSKAKEIEVEKETNLKIRDKIAAFGNLTKTDIDKITGNYRDLSDLTAWELEKPERFAIINLLCAKGLAGSEDLNIEECLTKLEILAKYIKEKTERHLYKYHKNPELFKNSEAYFRIVMLEGILKQDYGIKYNMDIEATDPRIQYKAFRDSKNFFLHGLLSEKKEGTCASMPILVIALGRLLGYPLKLVAAKNHFFAKWEDEDSNKSFNIEITNKGQFNSHPDEHYKKWPEYISEEEMNSYLKPMTRIEETAVFLNIRGNNLEDSGRLAEAKETYQLALELWADHPHKKYMRQKIEGITEFLRSPPPPQISAVQRQEILKQVAQGRVKYILRIAKEKIKQIDYIQSNKIDAISKQYQAKFAMHSHSFNCDCKYEFDLQKAKEIDKVNTACLNARIKINRDVVIPAVTNVDVNYAFMQSTTDSLTKNIQAEIRTLAYALPDSNIMIDTSEERKRKENNKRLRNRIHNDSIVKNHIRNKDKQKTSSRKLKYEQLMMQLQSQENNIGLIQEEIIKNAGKKERTK